MILTVFILAVLLIGWFVPRPIVGRVDGAAGIWAGSLVALLCGVGSIWAGATAVEAMGLGDAKTEFERGFNAWKIMLFIAPASALHRRRRDQRERG